MKPSHRAILALGLLALAGSAAADGETCEANHAIAGCSAATGTWPDCTCTACTDTKKEPNGGGTACVCKAIDNCTAQNGNCACTACSGGKVPSADGAECVAPTCTYPAGGGIASCTTATGAYPACACGTCAANHAPSNPLASTCCDTTAAIANCNAYADGTCACTGCSGTNVLSPSATACCAAITDCSAGAMTDQCTCTACDNGKVPATGGGSCIAPLPTCTAGAWKGLCGAAAAACRRPAQLACA